MNDLLRSLYAAWVSRLGSNRVAELAAGLSTGRTVDAKAEAIVESFSRSELDSVIVDGFQKFFHQSVYLRTASDGSHNVNNLRLVSGRRSRSGRNPG